MTGDKREGEGEVGVAMSVTTTEDPQERAQRLAYRVGRLVEDLDGARAERNEAMLDMLEEGYTQADVARTVHMSRARVAKWLSTRYASSKG